MTLQEKFTQQHVAKIRLSESAQIGEFGSSEETKVTPGTYNVYKVTKKDEGYYGLMYAQEGDFYNNIEHMDMTDMRGVDAATYGIADSREEYNTCLEDLYVNDGGSSPTAYVGKTNSGDGDFIVYTNDDNTAFFLDDENIYMNHLIEELCPEDAADIIDVVDGFYWLQNKREITTYFHGLDISEHTITVSEDERNIDAMVKAYISVYEAQKTKQEGAQDKLTPKTTEMQGFTQINLRDESIDYIERKDLDDVVVDAASNFAEVSYDGNDHYMCDEYRVERGRNHYFITQEEDNYTEEGHPLYTVELYDRGYYDKSPGYTLGEAFLEAAGITEDDIEPYVCCKDGFKPIDGAINLRYACEYDRRGNVTFAPKFKDKTDNILINAQLTRDGWNGVVAVGYNFRSQGETEIFEEIKFHNMRTQEVLDVVDKLQFEHMGTHINQEPDWSFAKEDNLER